MSSVRPAALAVVCILASCTGAAPDERARRYAAQALNEPESGLRVTERSELATPHHAYYYVTRAEGPPLTVVVPRRGEPFDHLTPGAFDRVARAEDAAHRLSQLGPDRVALWFAALAGGPCGMPDVDRPHFASADREDDGVRLSYTFRASEGIRRCVLELGDDGTLRRAHAEDDLATARAEAASRRWASDRAR